MVLRGGANCLTSHQPIVNDVDAPERSRSIRANGGAMSKTGWKRWLIPLVVMGSLAACDILSPDVDDWEKMAQELNRNRRKWVRAGIEDYTFTTHPLCECAPFFEGRALVSVVAGEIVGVNKIHNGGPVDSGFWGAWDTIDEAFEKVAGFIEAKVFFLEVEYDSEYGFPVEFRVDVNEQYVDDERVQDISDFTVTGG